MKIKNKNRTVYFIDQTSDGDHHMVFNACLLEILAAIYPSHKVIGVGIKSNQESINQLLNENNRGEFIFKPIKYSQPISNHLIFKLINYCLKEIKRFFNFNSILRTSNSNDLIVLSITTFTSFLLFKIQKLFFKVPVIAVLHGDLDFVYNATNFYEKMNGLFHKIIFKLKKKNFYYLVLNKISKKYLVRDSYLKSMEVLEIDHPFNFLESMNKVEEKEKIITSVAFGHIGSLEVNRKSSHFIYSLGAHFKEEVNSKILSFNAIGLSTPSMKKYRNKWVKHIVGNGLDGIPKYLPRNIYEAELEKLDYALFFYAPNEYVFRASGAIADAIAKFTPIIVLKHPYFDYLFKKAGNIGHICNDMEEVIKLITEIKEDKKKFEKIREVQKKNFKSLQELISMEAITADLKAQMIQHEILV